jgi:hypothetical protein
MSIRWVQSIRERACNRAVVKVLPSFPRLTGKTGSVCRCGYTGRDDSVEVYELEVKYPNGGTKKHVVASAHCRLQYVGQDQSCGSAASQKEGSGDRDAELPMQTRSGGGCGEPSPSANLKNGHSAANVCWV